MIEIPRIFDEKLRKFTYEMRRMFNNAEYKHEGSSVLDAEVDWNTFDWKGIEDHFWEEVREVQSQSCQAKEWVDVANMAFLMWVMATEGKIVRKIREFYVIPE